MMNRHEAIVRARDAMKPLARDIEVTENGVTQTIKVTREGVGIIKPEEGNFYQFNFTLSDVWGKYSVLILAEIDSTFNPVFKKDELTIRVDSGCQTGHVFGDRACECREQLRKAMTEVQTVGEGMIVHIPHQDGRGKGLAFKLATLLLQEEAGLDTVDAAEALTDGEIDVRTYGGVIGILKFLNIHETKKIRLATNNPKKTKVFSENGYSIESLIPIVIPPTEYTEPHLQAKQDKLGHIELIP